MPLDSGVAASRSGALAAGSFAVNLGVAEETDSVEHTNPPFNHGPARGILIGVMIGAGAWMSIFAAVALAR